MALNRYVLTNTVQIPAGTVTGGSAAQTYGTEFSTPGAGTYGIFPVQFIKGQIIIADPAGLLFAAIGAGNLRNWVDGQDTVGHAATAN